MAEPESEQERTGDDMTKKIRWLLLGLLAASFGLGLASLLFSTRETFALSVNLRLAGLYILILNGILYLVFRRKMQKPAGKKEAEPLQNGYLGAPRLTMPGYAKVILVIIGLVLFIPALMLLMFLPSLFLPM